MKTLIAIAALASCVGCGSWSRPNTNEAEFRRDSYECERDQRAVSSSFITRRPYPDAPNAYGAIGGGLTQFSDTSSEIGFFFRCMESKGYRYE